MRRPRFDRLLLPAKRLILISLVFDIGAACVVLALQFKGISLKASPFMLGVLGGSLFVISPFISVIAGHLSDRFGRRFMTAGAACVCLLAWGGMSLAGSVWQLLPLAVLSGVGMALIWPPLEAWLGDLSGSSSRLLNRNIGLFNLAWTAGLMAGPLAAGQLWDAYGARVFLLAGGTALACLLIAILTPTPATAVEHVEPPAHVDPARVSRFLILAWIGMAAAVFSRGIVNACFPKLGTELGFSPALLGQLLFSLAAGQAVAFLITRLTTRWQYRDWPLIAPPLAAMGTMLLAAFTNSPALFALSFAITGMAVGLGFMTGITYALQAEAESRGRRVGMHEGINTLGLVLGPVLGGLVGQYWGLHEPFQLGAAVCLLALLAQWYGMRRRRG